MVAAVPVEYNSAGSYQLPPASQHQGAEMWATVDTSSLWHGLVRIRYRSIYMKHGKNGHGAWVAEFAEKA